VLRQIPASKNPNLLVGFETSDDAGVFMLPGGQALVQTVDFFTPVVDDPYAYGQIAAANSLSDVYAMGGQPLTVLNIACFNPAFAEPEVWAAIFKGMADKTIEAGAVILGGHSVEDNEPKFGMSVTGIVDPSRMFANTNAKPGDRIYLSKPLGTGIVNTAIKNDLATPEETAASIEAMSQLNRDACELGLKHGVRCATDITGFGLAGHLFNIAKGSGVTIEIDHAALPLLPGVQRLAELDQSPGGAGKNRSFLGDCLHIESTVPEWMHALIVDPQTSGGLALFSQQDLPSLPQIGEVVVGTASVRVR
jgi:selenide,water dikinase